MKKVRYCCLMLMFCAQITSCVTIPRESAAIEKSEIREYVKRYRPVFKDSIARSGAEGELILLKMLQDQTLIGDAEDVNALRKEMLLGDSEVFEAHVNDIDWYLLLHFTPKNIFNPEEDEEDMKPYMIVYPFEIAAIQNGKMIKYATSEVGALDLFEDRRIRELEKLKNR